jgi:glycosyltransferase 2 family protein
MTVSPRPARSDPWTRLWVGVTALGLSILMVERDGVGPTERRLFGAVNRLPDGLQVPAWAVMQAGALGAAPVAAAIAHRCGRDRLARRLVVGATATWCLSKVVKRFVRRPRPAALIVDAQRRGRDQSGLGFVSGHAAVAAGMCAAAVGELGPVGRSAATATAVSVALARMYIGAHLPLDLVGGAALGIAVDAVLELHEGSGLGPVSGVPRQVGRGSRRRWDPQRPTSATGIIR